MRSRRTKTRIVKTKEKKGFITMSLATSTVNWKTMRKTPK